MELGNKNDISNLNILNDPLSIYPSLPSIKKNNKLILTRTINNQLFYKQATIITGQEYTLRLKKTFNNSFVLKFFC